MKMKKLGLCFCTAVLAFGLAACGKGAKEGGGSQGTEQTGESGNVESGSALGSGNTPESGGSAASDSASVPGGSAESGDWGDLGADGWSEEMAGLRAAVVEAVGEENYWPNMPMTPDLFEMYYGITADMCEDYMAEAPMISAHVDALVIVRAKSGQADAVEAALDAYRDALVNDTMQYPSNLGKIQASRVERMGDYVVFVQLGGSAIDAEAEAEVIRLCQEANGLAVEAVRGKVEGK